MGYPGLWMCGLIGFILFTIRTEGLSSGLPGFWTKKARQAESVGHVTSSSAPDRIICPVLCPQLSQDTLELGWGLEHCTLGGFHVLVSM